MYGTLKQRTTRKPATMATFKARDNTMKHRIKQIEVRAALADFVAKGGQIKQQPTEIAQQIVTARRHLDPQRRTLSEIFGVSMRIEGGFQG